MKPLTEIAKRYLRRWLNSGVVQTGPDERLGMSLREWLLYHQSAIASRSCTWRGLKAIKNPLDCWIYQEMLWEVKPETVVEIGSAAGGSTLFFADMLELMGRGKVVSVDVDRSNFSASHPRIITVTGRSSDPETVLAVRSNCGTGPVFLIHDADHSRDQVLADLEAYCGLVTPGSYFVVEDGIIDLFNEGDGIGTGTPGPMAAIRDFLKDHPEFSPDKERERYLLTYSPGGFLKRNSASVTS